MKTCGDCIHADICENDPSIPGFNRDNLAYCQGFRAEQKWIPVTERLPEERHWVLVWHTGYGTAKKAKYKDEGLPMFVLDGHCDNNGEVTHWMPLPEPPKGE
jgi:hypothetical protein